MTEQQARDLCRSRQSEKPEYRWSAQKRKDDDWVVVRLPGGGQINPASVAAEKGPPAEVGDDPRPAIMRNIPPFGPGL